MHRVAALILCCTLLVVAAIVAAPAPFPTRAGRASGPWVDGWDSPVNPRGDCRFDRRGDRLTITVRGSERDPDWPRGMLLRDVEGDFVVRVHLGGQVRQGEPYRREAGFQLAAGQWRLCAGVTRGWLDIQYNTEDGRGQLSPALPQKCHVWRPGEGWWLVDLNGQEPVLLLLRRRGLLLLSKPKILQQLLAHFLQCFLPDFSDIEFYVGL